MDQSTDILFALDKKGQIIAGNQRLYSVYGNIKELNDFKDKSTIEAIKKQQQITVMAHNCEHQISTTRIKDITYVCMKDVTLRNKLRRRLDMIVSRLSYTEKSIKVGYWEFDIKTKKIIWSDEMYSIWNYPQNKDIKKNWLKNHTHPDDRNLYKKKINQLLVTGKPVETILRLVLPNQQIKHCLIRASLLHDGDGDCIAGTMQDLTELIEMQIELDKAKNKAEELNLAKSYFLAQASHDLRQPMQALKIFIYNLLATTLDKKQQQIVQKIDTSATNLNALLDNLLDISKIESGGFRLHSTTFNLKTLFDHILEDVDPLAASKNIEIRNKIHCDLIVTTDAILVERIIRNLLSNALKYTKNKILIGCKYHNHIIKIIICDNGFGIAKFELPYIFDEFFQSDHIEENKKQGAGLGLPIVRKITQIMDGKVRVKSSLGKGSCFIVELPVATPPQN